MKTHNNLLILALASMALLGMMGCGSNSSGGSSPAAGPVPVTPGYNSVNGYAVTACSGRNFSTSAGAFSYQTEAYVSGSIVNPNLIRVRITQLPTDFNTTNGYIVFFAYSYDSTGSVGSSEIQVPFYTETYNGTNSFTGPGSPSEGYQFAMNGTSISGVDFVVDLTNNPYAQVLNVALYNSTPATNANLHSVESLIPSFYANPNEYNSTHVGALQAIHPLANLAGNNYSDAQYASYASQLCF